ncbi:hypothetical protein CcrC1_gp393 [Caulobacter phage C1]|nr:hypothetical protein CcrC1_gp393 [Caulobacter phage C1]UTU08622.1 hypothetical protein CcrC2_gp394 [Caulobacter phage C2]UTU09137.1 hypothetical protein CcrJ4_gp388 [Caulobacter phage J4]UTU10255.1 hypothetical protein CcrRB23_gp393 [Caulobacter phage RB23]WGN97289.1 hypothetical protein [Bertelyvirus sp.]
MKDAIYTLDREPIKRHPQFYLIEMGHEPGEFWISGYVRARTPQKAIKKARRIQKNTGWPFLRVDDQPTRREAWADVKAAIDRESLENGL